MSALIILLLFIPGFSLACLLTCWRSDRQDTLILSVPLSLIIYLFLSIAFQFFSVSRFIVPAYVAVGTVLFVAALGVPFARRAFFRATSQGIYFLPVIAAIVALHLVNGAFIDFGVDLFQHLVFVQDGLRYLSEHGGELKFAAKPGTTNYLFHNIGVLAIHYLDISTVEFIEISAIAYSLLWTLGIYCFCDCCFERMGIAGKLKYILVLFAVFFYWTTFGINNFSFARYYIGGPVILNYCIYLAAVSLLLKQLASEFRVLDTLLMVVFLGAAMVLHPQEVILWAVFFFGLAAAVLIYRLAGISTEGDIPIAGRNSLLALLYLFTASLLISIGIIALDEYRYNQIPLLNLGFISSDLSRWSILRPNHQFYTVLGLWGLWVYVVALIQWRHVLRQPLVVATLLLPLITVFNPLFTEAYMRFAYPSVLWRVLFAMVLPVAAGFLLWSVFDSIKKSRHIARWWRLVVIVPLFATIGVFTLGPVKNTMAKSPSLMATPEENSYQHWSDLLRYLDALPKTEKILSDPVTGYVIRSMTRHRHFGFKFFPRNYREINFTDYSNKPLKRYRNWLLVINLRDGSINHRLNPPHHIYPDVMVTSKYYGQPLREHLTDRSMFELLFEENGISVFRIL